MADETTPTSGSNFSGLDILFTVLGALATKGRDPLLYPRFKAAMETNRLENLLRQSREKKFQEQEAQLKRPLTDFYPMESNKPEMAGNLPPEEMGFGFEPPAVPVTTKPSETINLQGKTLADLPAINTLLTARKKENIPITWHKDSAGNLVPLKGSYEAGTEPPKPIKAEKDDPAIGQPWQDEDGNLWQSHKIGPPTPVMKKKKVETVETTGDLFRPTQKQAEERGLGLEQIRGKRTEKTPRLPLHRDYSEAGVTWRQEYEDDGVTKKGAPYKVHTPAPERGEKGLAQGKIDTMYANYNIARVKDKFDPSRIQMEADFRDEGIDVPERMPELSPEEFKTYVTKGKLPEKKEKAKAGPTKDTPPPITPTNKGFATYEGKKTNWYWDGSEWKWIEGKK